MTELFDYLTLSVYPFLKKYIETKFKLDPKQQEERWGYLKGAMITDRLQGTKPLEDEFAYNFGEIMGLWR